MRLTHVCRIASGLLVAAALGTLAQPFRGQEQLVVLSDTGETRDGLPVAKIHDDPEEVENSLGRGFPGLMLRLYGLEQQYLARAEGIEPEPVYLLLSDRQGGFGRIGFYLGEEDKSNAGYVDVHREWTVSGRFGALDQIVPHELAHVMRRQLAGELEDGGTNQVHSLGVRTDPVVAFNEGFAEHLQTMAIEHPDALPETAALQQDHDSYLTVMRRLDEYRGEITARLAVAPRLRMGFVAWFSNGEDVLRYFAIKDNDFLHEVPLPRHLSGADPYRAYLLESLLLGDPEMPVKPLPRLLATEGVVAAFFYRWASDENLRTTYRDESFYGLFGTTASDVPPELNVYLKMLQVLYVAKPQRLQDFVEGYRAEFPDEAARVEQLAVEVFGSSILQRTPEIWMANRDFETGTTVFDQYRGLPRTHTFDLNAASLVDLVGIPGMTLELARSIQDEAPFESVEELAGVTGISPELAGRFREMVFEMKRLRAELEEENVVATLSIWNLLAPYLWRAGAALALATVVGGVLHRGLRLRRAGPEIRFSWWRTGLNGLAASVVGLAAGWATGQFLAPFLAVGILFGVPAAIWCGIKTRRGALATRVLIAWTAAAAPGLVLITPWF